MIMGSGRWSSGDYTRYATSTNYRAKSVREVFESRNVPDMLNPAKLKLRESCDSADNPESTPIILALDVTGSMGRYASEIAKDHLPTIMTRILEERPVTDPHMMFMGIDDVACSPGEALQVSQFEADIRILEQLRNIFLVGNGGGNGSESYDLAWYFAANKTKIDSFEKRGQKGYLFTFGDELAPERAVTNYDLKRTFATGEFPECVTPEAMLEAAQQRYHVFHVIIEQGDFASRDVKGVRKSWKRLLGKNVICVRDTAYLADIILATLHIANGADPELVLGESKCRKELEYAFQVAKE
jgi:hypothetical protein